MSDIILTSPNGTKYKLVVTDAGFINTVICDDEDENVQKIHLTAVIGHANNNEQIRLCNKLMNEGNKLVHISPNASSHTKQQYMHFIKISNDILFMNDDDISDETFKFIRYALDLGKPISLFKPMSQDQFNKLLEV